jgi:hypothetical protein
MKHWTNKGIQNSIQSMILLHRYMESARSEVPLGAGTATFTRTRNEASDQDQFFMAGTKTLTAVRAEAQDADHDRKWGAVFPRSRDPHHHQLQRRYG